MTTQRKIIKTVAALTGIILGLIFLLNPEGVSPWTIRIIGLLLLVVGFLRFGVLFNEVYKK